MAYDGPFPLKTPDGGTGDSSFTAYAPIVGGTTSTGNLQSASTGLSTSGFVLTSTGASSLPTFQAVSASGAVTTLDGDSGSATPSSGVITVSGGTTGLTTSGASHTLSLTGTLIVGNGGTGDSSFTAYAPICGGTTTTAALQSVATGTAGYVLTYNSSSSLPTWQALPPSALAWNDEAANFNAVGFNGYFVTATATATLPTSPTQGETIAFSTDGSGSILTIRANTGQSIRIGNTVSMSAGSAVNNVRGDSVTLVYRLADTSWIASSVIGTWTIT